MLIHVHLQVDLIDEILLSECNDGLAGNMELIRSLHHSCLQREIALFLVTVTLGVNNTAIVRSTRKHIAARLPLLPLLAEETRKPITVNASLAVEEPNEAEHVTIETGSGNTSNHSISREIARSSSNHSIHEEIGPGTVIGEEHRFPGIQRFRLLYHVETGFKQASDL